MFKCGFIVLMWLLAFILTSACTDKLSLAESSFGKIDGKSSKASPANVISMGRDDDDGKAKKWHIGGSKN
jgi:hypothetical protein